MNSKKIFVPGLLVCFAASAAAQQKNADTTIKATTIEITQIYQPQIKHAVKEIYQPTLPAVAPSPARFIYEVPDHRLQYSYKPLPLQALASPKDSLYKGYHHYVKAGFGNQRTLLLDAGLGAINTKRFLTNAHLGILSQKGNIAYQKQTMGSLSANTIYAGRRTSYTASLDATHHNFYQYGYDESLQPAKIPGKQSLSGAKVSFGSARENSDTSGRFLPDFNVFAAAYTGSNINNEVSVGGAISANRALQENMVLHAGIEGVATKVNSALYSVSNNKLSVRAGLNGKPSDFFHYKIFLAPTVGQSNNTFLLQDVAATFHFSNAQFVVGAGTQGLLQQNTYQQLFLANPYISQFSSKQTHSNEVFAYAEKGLGHHIHLGARLSWWQWENMATYLNYPVGTDQEKMMVYYIPRLNAVSAKISMRYQIGTSLSFGGTLSLFRYNNITTTNKVWHTPNTQLSGDLEWNPRKDLCITAYGSYLSGNYAMDTLSNTVKLKAIADIGAGAEYNVMEKLSFFLKGNNLLNSKYQRWMGYQAYGINIYGGVRLKF